LLDIKIVAHKLLSTKFDIKNKILSDKAKPLKAYKKRERRSPFFPFFSNNLLYVV
jgi:hypothetical protein